MDCLINQFSARWLNSEDKIFGEMLEGTQTDLVVYFGADSFEGPAGTDRQMAQALTKYAPVLYVEPPISALALLRKMKRRNLSTPPLQVLNQRLARLITYVVPGMSRPLLHRLVGPMVSRTTRAALRQLYPVSATGDFQVAAVVSSQVDILWSAIPARRKLFYSTDDMLSGAELWGIPRERLLRAEALMLRSIDAIAVVSPVLRDRYARAGIVAELVPNGCNPEAYLGVDDAPLPTDVALKGPIAGFIGHINDRIDICLLEAVANAGCSLLLVGPVAEKWQSATRFVALTARSNVCWVGRKDFADLPSYLRIIDVGLTPYANTEFNRASFPLKTLEYLAAGRAVVGTPLPANDWLATDFIKVASGPVDYAAQVRAVLDQPHRAALDEQRRRFARDHSWAHRATLMARLMGLEPTPRLTGNDVT